MTLSVTQWLAWVLPIAAGVAAYLALCPQRGAGWRVAALGQGIVFGLLLAAAATALFARADTQHALAHVVPWLALFALCAGTLAWKRIRRSPRPAAAGEAEIANKWISILCGLALASLTWRGWLALREILLRPTFPWDAWDAWAVKSKTWFLLGHYAPFVSVQDWLARPTADLFTGPAWSYPATLGWMQVWFASAAGDWIEPAVNLPWFALWVGLLLGHYGQWRALGLSRVRALVFVYILGSLPLIAVHVALAGYADLWIATIFGFGVLAWLRWIERRERSQLALAAICVLSLPLIKLEGAVWLLLFVGVAGFGLLSRRFRRRVVATIAAVAIVAGLFGVLALPLPGLGWVHIGATTIDIPVIGKLAIAWHGAAFGGVLVALFAQPNWHLLWWLLPLIVVWRWQELREHESLRRLGALLLLGLGFLLFLFVFTDAARWAESFTAVNRLILHIVPITVTMLALLCRNVDFAALRDTGSASVSPLDRA
jgi:hypothetical protein